MESRQGDADEAAVAHRVSVGLAHLAGVLALVISLRA